jgi:hypothetical protein
MFKFHYPHETHSSYQYETEYALAAEFDHCGASSHRIGLNKPDGISRLKAKDASKYLHTSIADSQFNLAYETHTQYNEELVEIYCNRFMKPTRYIVPFCTHQEYLSIKLNTPGLASFFLSFI